MTRVLMLDFGWWRVANGRRGLLSWNSNTGELTIYEPGNGTRCSVMAVINDEVELRRRLEGWAEHCETREGLGWLAQRLEGCR